MCFKKQYKKGECKLILNSNIRYYTKEFIKILKIAFIAFIIITAIILIKYKPQYKVLIADKKIGYIDSQTDIDKFIEEEVNSIENKNIAFVDLENRPVFKLELVSRSEENTENIIKEEIQKQLIIEYTNYAIAINGKNETYVSTKEEAQKIVDELKKEYAEKYTKKLGIIQVYSEDYSEISSVSSKEAKKVISSELKKAKKSDTIKLAKANKAKVASTKSKVIKVKKASSVKGVKFTAKPVSGIITSRFGRRSSPGGVGSTNHKGLDIAAKCGTSIYAAAGGKVIHSGYKGALGKLVIIDHGNGVKSYYAHCNKLNISSGAKVNAGTKIAEVGRTGTATGYHLHFEIRVNGTSVNPQTYIY